MRALELRQHERDEERLHHGRDLFLRNRERSNDVQHCSCSSTHALAGRKCEAGEHPQRAVLLPRGRLGGVPVRWCEHYHRMETWIKKAHLLTTPWMKLSIGMRVTFLRDSTSELMKQSEVDVGFAYESSTKSNGHRSSASESQKKGRNEKETHPQSGSARTRAGRRQRARSRPRSSRRAGTRTARAAAARAA